MASIRTLIIFLLFVCAGHTAIQAKQQVVTDSLITILQSGNSKASMPVLMDILYMRYFYSSKFDHTINFTNQNLIKYKKKEAPSLGFFVNALINYRKGNFETARKYLIKAIGSARELDDKYLLYHFQSNMAYISLAEGDPFNAIHSFQIARKHAAVLGNLDFVVKNAAGISELYNRIELYGQALHYLNEAEAAAIHIRGNNTLIDSYLNYNKTEIYFKLGLSDSVSKYKQLLLKADNSVLDIDRLRIRADYFWLITQGKYHEAIKRIKELLKTKRFDQDLDQWYLADSFYKVHSLDSAKSVALALTSNRSYAASQLKYNALKLLAQIAQDEGNNLESFKWLKKAVDERDRYVDKLIRLGAVAEDMRVEELESSYLARTLVYERQRSVLIAAIVVVILVLTIIGLLYRNIKERRRFEKIFTSTKTNELSLINSHSVRKHLANIIGLTAILTDQTYSNQELNAYHAMLSEAAKDLDTSVKEVENKLKDMSENQPENQIY
jgi:tetratricopeptide (TPR) repeat protein